MGPFLLSWYNPGWEGSKEGNSFNISTLTFTLYWLFICIEPSFFDLQTQKAWYDLSILDDAASSWYNNIYLFPWWFLPLWATRANFIDNSYILKWFDFFQLLRNKDVSKEEDILLMMSVMKSLFT